MSKGFDMNKAKNKMNNAIAKDSMQKLNKEMEKVMNNEDNNIIEENENNELVIEFKQDSKILKKSLNVIVDATVNDRLDELAKETNRSKNELINIFIEDGLKRVKVKK